MTKLSSDCSWYCSNNGAKSVILLTDHRIVFPVYHFYLDLQWYASVLIYRRSFFHVDNELHDAFTNASNKSCWNFVFLSHFCIHSKSERKWNAPKRIKRRDSLKQKQFAYGVKKNESPPFIGTWSSKCKFCENYFDFLDYCYYYYYCLLFKQSHRWFDCFQYFSFVFIFTHAVAYRLRDERAQEQQRKKTSKTLRLEPDYKSLSIELTSIW